MLFSFLCISFSKAMPHPTLKDLLHEDGWNTFKTIQDNTVDTITVQEKYIHGFPCFRAFAQSTVPISVFGKVAKDIPSSLRWSSSGLTESILIKHDKNQIDYYQYLSIPFLSDRHWFLQAEIQSTPEEFRFIWTPIPAGQHKDFIAKKKKEHPHAVEPPINIGEWRFTNNAQKVMVQYSICTHPGGSVPKQLRSVGTVRTLPTNVKEMILEGRKHVQ